MHGGRLMVGFTHFRYTNLTRRIAEAGPGCSAPSRGAQPFIIKARRPGATAGTNNISRLY